MWDSGGWAGEVMEGRVDWLASPPDGSRSWPTPSFLSGAARFRRRTAIGGEGLVDNFPSSFPPLASAPHTPLSPWFLSVM